MNISARFHPVPYLASLGVIAATATYGALIFDSLPEPYPTHSDFSGPDAWGAKTVWNVFGPLMVVAGVACLMALLARVTARSLAQRGWGEGASDRRNRLGAELTLPLLASVTVCMTIMVCALVILTWNNIWGWPTAVFGFGFVAVTLFMVGRTLWKMLRLAPGPDAPETARAADADPALWIGGVIYNNPDDERVVVPKRCGVGTTINYARPAGKVFYFGTLLVVLVAVAAAIFGG